MVQGIQQRQPQGTPDNRGIDLTLTLPVRMTSPVADLNLPLLNAARQAIQDGALQKAAETLNKANRQNPNDPRVHLVGSWLAEVSGNLNGALDRMQRAVTLAPNWTPGQLGLGLLLVKHRRFVEALAASDTALKLEPDNMSVLMGSVEISRKAGDLERSVRLLRHALTIVPNDPQLRLMIATDLQRHRQHDESLQVWNSLATEFPETVEPRLARVQIALAKNDPAGAKADADWLVEKEPANETFQYYQAVANGKVPDSQPAALTMGLFDWYAETFDAQLVGSLAYRLPKLVADRILAERADKKFNVLDLGCGTGLLGACLGRLQGALVGVELSSKMIEQAAKHGVYDKFHTVNLHDALEATPDSLYEIIAALDVFVYAGTVDKAIPNAHRILTPGGQFVASFEEAAVDGPNMELRPSGRYAHKRSHVQSVFEQAGFVDVVVQDVLLRMEAGNPLNGYVVWGRKAVSH